jgi:hypothetical protein
MRTSRPPCEEQAEQTVRAAASSGARVSVALAVGYGSMKKPASSRCAGRPTAAADIRGLPIAGCPGTTKGWVNPSPAHSGATLVVDGGFVVDDGRTRHLEQRTRALGFADLRGYLQARSDGGLSIPRLAAELGVTQWTTKQALTQAGVQLPPRPQRLARQRRHATDQRLAARAAELGFADLRAYLADRLITRVAACRGHHRAWRPSGDGAAAAGPARHPAGTADGSGAGRR